MQIIFRKSLYCVVPFSPLNFPSPSSNTLGIYPFGKNTTATSVSLLLAQCLSAFRMLLGVFVSAAAISKR